MALVELTQAVSTDQSGTVVDGNGSTVDYSLTGAGGNFASGYGDIDGSNIYLGNGAETLSIDFQSGGNPYSVTGLVFKLNATNQGEIMDFTINGVDVNLNTLIANGDVTIIQDSGQTNVNANGDLDGDNTQFPNSDMFMFNFPIQSMQIAHNGAGSGSLVELFVDDSVSTITPDGTVHGNSAGEVMGDGYDDSANSANGDVIGDNPADGVGGFDNHDDIVLGYSGEDTISAGLGNDLVYGGTQNDVISGGAGADILFGDAGGDLVQGNSGEDIITGGSGEDTLEGGVGNDQLSGGNGDDLMVGGSGEDVMKGGFGSDTFDIDDQASDTIVGNEDTDNSDVDVLDLSDIAGLYSINYAGGDDEDGSVVMEDSGGTATGDVLVFQDIEKIICFTRGTRITTANGDVAVEDLSLGDTVQTMDNGFQPIRWIGKRTVPAYGKLAPIMFKAGALDNHRDLRVSPQHRMLVQDWRAETLFGEFEVLSAAKHFVNGDTIFAQEGGDVEYFHILFDTHEIIFAEGAATESFHPGEEGARAVDPEQYEELLSLFPELRQDVSAYGPSARMTLKTHEGRLIAHELIA